MEILGNTEKSLAGTSSEPSLAMSRERRLSANDRGPSAMGSGAWACVILVLLAFGGGLGIAFFGFNSPEISGRLASVQPEVSYLRPPGAETSPASTQEPTGELTEFSSHARILNPSEQDAPLASTPLHLWSMTAGQETPWSTLDDSQSDISGSFAAGVGSSFSNVAAPEGAATVTGFSALQSASIPEPSTWAMILAGAATMVFLAQRQRARAIVIGGNGPRKPRRTINRA